ncbi:MAG: hypothetical protein C0425_00105 [Chlorobiaceae bacterium]|nr:hypothetical protein [Chlorobiaceae bacterium]MBA4308725.1 hypothetical protein [Chlorobiaceae bacterium]
MKKFFTVMFFLLISFNITFAGGFQTGTQGARAMGMGHAFVGLASDPSAMYFNAAGIANLKGMNFMAGTTFIMPTVNFTGPTPLEIESETVARTFTPINFYGTYALDNGFTFGVAVFNPYGLGSEWPATWVGKSLAVETELRTFYINPTVAYKFSDNFQIGLGFNYIISSILFYQVIDIPAIPVAPGVTLPAAPNVGVNLEGDGKAAYTFNIGLLYKPMDKLSIGLAYRHEAKIDFEGDLTFQSLPKTHAALFPEGKGTSSLTMPYDLRVGLSYLATEDLTLNLDAQYVGWESYEALAVDFDKNTPAWTDLKTLKNWENSFTLRFGGEYRMDAFAFRAGYVYDGSPIPTRYMDPSLPGDDRHEFTIGLGYQITPNIRADVAYQFISFENTVDDSAIRFNGTYKNTTNLFGFNLGFAF